MCRPPNAAARPPKGTGQVAAAGPGDTPQGTWSVRLDAVTDCVADLNAQARRHGCRCEPRASFTPLPGDWFVANTTHDADCPAVGGAR